MAHIHSFTDPRALMPAQTGGKGVNLARLTQAGFDVPPGFVITSDAYALSVVSEELKNRISDFIKELNYNDPAAVEKQSAAIGDAFEAAPLPAGLAEEIVAAYAALGGEPFVAVRSSGTAEDLAAASFAGQHDTYLDVCGARDVVAAVKRCWASLWTARAAIYRQSKGFDHSQVRIAVVVQKMVRAEIAGVMFTANPHTTATDETVINATWGLGESLVQGMVTPDTFVVQSATGTVIEQTAGEKEVRIVRDSSGTGVMTQEVPPGERSYLCLTSAQVANLTAVGSRVQNWYGGFPQDIEWAIEDDRLYLLQSRPITGVEFAWDADVDLVHTQAAPVHTVWTRAFGDALASGVVSPLTYSTRFHIFSGINMKRIWGILGQDDLCGTRAFKWWKGELYYNANLERTYVERLVPRPFRSMLLDFVPPAWHEGTLAAPFDESRFLRALSNWQMGGYDDAPLNLPKTFEKWRTRTDYEGVSYAELRKLDDEQVIAYCRRMTEIFIEWNQVMWAPFLFTMRTAMSALRWMIGAWYDEGDAQATFAKLVAGATSRTDTQIENAQLSALVSEIRRSPELRTALDAHQDGSFFEALTDFEQGRRFLARYAEWISTWGHRGHADRDYMYPRRAEDPAIDVRSFKLLLHASEDRDDTAAELALARERDATLAAVLANISSKPDGAMRAAMLEAVHTLVHQYLVIRDNERSRPTDVLTYSRKRGYVEIGRRLYERRQIQEPRDFHFLSEIELFQLFRREIANTDLLKAKIKGRALCCDRMLKKQANMPMHLQRNRPIDLDHAIQDATDGVFRGTPTSPGLITATARLLMDHTEMGRLKPGEILITHSTDPGWNPVFGIISAVVVETGGMLSHASCLAREYGFPAVHLPHATKLVPDGARITVDGHTGTVTVLDAVDESASKLALDASPMQSAPAPLAI